MKKQISTTGLYIMKKSVITFTCVLLGLFSNTTNAQVISVGSGTDFSIGSGTLVSADSLDITPSANFIFNGCSMVKSIVANNSTSIPYIKKVYQFSNTTNAFSGALKMFYSNASLNGLTESGLKFLIHNGSSWSLDNNSSVNTTNKFVQNNAVNGITFKELTAATCTPTSSIDTKTACGSYIWHGTTYTASNNTATWTGTNAAGCDSVVTLNLTITPLPTTPIVNVVNNCNSTSTLTTTATGTLLWSTGATTSSIIVSSAGTYTVTQTVDGCTSLAGSGTAAPKTTPATPIVTVVNNCNGTSTLSTIPSGPLLVWSTGSTSYSTIVSSAGTYNVRQMVDGCMSEAGFGTAAPKTTPVTPTVNVVNNCNGTSILSTTALGTLLWSTGATTSSIIVSSAGTYTVRQTADGCASEAGSGTAAPKATPATPIVNVVNNCNGTSTLSTTATGTLLWSTGATTYSIIVNSAGTYTVRQTVDGCTSEAGSGTAAPKTVPATPMVNVVNNCNGTSTLSTTATGTLLWSTGATTSYIIVSSAGTYTVRQSVDGCASEAGSGVAAPQTSNTSTTTETVCGSYTWSVNNVTYTTSGTYTSVSSCATEILSLTILPSASVTITSNQSSICAGTAVTFTATPTNGGTNPIYQWKLNGNNVGTNSNTYTNSNLSSTDVVKVEMTPISNVSDDVTIGSQVWTSKNLEVTTYRNGDPITQVTNPTQWLGMTTGAYCYLNYDSVNNSKYGKLYNWYAVNDSRGLAPFGYHIPAINEVDTLILSVNYDAKSIMSTTGWTDFSGNDASGTNSSGFNALPSGGHGNSGSGYFENLMGIFWTSQESGNNARFYGCFSWEPNISNSSDEEKRNGYPVRLIKESAVENSNFCSGTVTSSAISVTVNQCYTTLNVKAYLEGFYRDNGTMSSTLYDIGNSDDPTATDTITVSLWSPASLTNASPNYSVHTILHTNGTASVQFPGATLGNSYYVAIKHRNSIEIWSAEPVTIASVGSYDFSTSFSSVYSDGFNDAMKSVSGGNYALYSGDVNQDGSIDLFDAQITENGASNLLFGYDASDCNGDGSTDLFDLQLIENNGTLLIFTSRPY